MFDVEVDSKAAEKRLSDTSDRLSVRSGAGQIMREALVGHIEETYETGNRGEWASLDPATVKAKGSGRILVDTGDLLRSLSDPKVRGDAVVSETGVAYAEHLKSGARGMPKRDPAPEPDHGFVTDLAADLASYIADGRRS